MAKTQQAAEPRRAIVATAHFRHDGAPVEPGQRLTVSEPEAAELIAMHFATSAPYRDRAMRARGR